MSKWKLTAEAAIPSERLPMRARKQANRRLTETLPVVNVHSQGPFDRSLQKRPRARGCFGAGQAPARNGLGEKALRGREINPAILHCAEQPARFFLLAEYDTRVALKMLSEIAIRQQPSGCRSVPQKGALPRNLPRACVPSNGAGQVLASIWLRTQNARF